MWYERGWQWLKEHLTITVPGAVLIFAGTFIVMLAVKSGEAGAAWVQAVGSVAAILAVVWVFHAEYEKDEELRALQEQDRSYMRTRRLRVFIGHVREYIAHSKRMGLSTRPTQQAYHEKQMDSFQTLFGQLLLDEDDLIRLEILRELSRHLYTVQGCFIPGRHDRTDVDDDLAALGQRLETIGY